MCGIDAYLNLGRRSNAGKSLYQGLLRVQDRGYDSGGQAVIDGNTLVIKKGVGKIFDLNKILELSKMIGYVGIGHTRWATHGNINEDNAHPHTDCKSNIAVVHNGQIDNYKELKNNLEKRGHKIEGTSDTVVIPHIIEDFVKKGYNTLDAVYETTKLLKGTYALEVINTQNPRQIVLTRSKGPEALMIGVSKDAKRYWATSSTKGFPEKLKGAIRLRDQEFALLDADEGVKLYDSELNEVHRNLQKVKYQPFVGSSNGHAVRMKKEIKEQKDMLRRSLRMLDKGILDDLANDVVKAPMSYTIAAGSSHLAAIYGSFLEHNINSVVLEAKMCQEANYLSVVRKDTPIIAISQSGETADILDPIRKIKERPKDKQPKIYSIVNAEETSLEDLVGKDKTLHLNVGGEFGVAATKSCTGQMVTLLKLAVVVGKKKGIKKMYELEKSLCRIPGYVDYVVKKRGNEMKELGEDLGRLYKSGKITDAFFIGHRENVVSAREGALKLKEVSQINAQAYNAGELRHGPMSLIESYDKPKGKITGTPLIVGLPTRKSSIYDMTINNAHQAKNKGAYVIGLIDERDNNAESLGIFDRTVKMPSTSPYIRPIVDTVAYQILSMNASLVRNLNPDYPRNLSKSIVVR